MLVYYINLANRPDRRAHIEEELARVGLTAVRIEAATPADIEPADLARYSDPRRVDWHPPAVLACAASHQRVFRAMLATAAPYALILEDDAVLSSRLPKFLAAFTAASPPVDVLRLETTLRPVAHKPEGAEIAGVTLNRFIGGTAGSAAYIVSRRAAEAFLADRDLYRRPIDVALFGRSGQATRGLVVRQANPALGIQTVTLHKVPTRLGTDINDDTRAKAERPYALRHAFHRFRRNLRRDTVGAARKLWFRFVGGAKRARIPFAAD